MKKNFLKFKIIEQVKLIVTFYNLRDVCSPCNIICLQSSIIFQAQIPLNVPEVNLTILFSICKKQENKKKRKENSFQICTDENRK